MERFANYVDSVNREKLFATQEQINSLYAIIVEISKDKRVSPERVVDYMVSFFDALDRQSILTKDWYYIYEENDDKGVNFVDEKISRTSDYKLARGRNNIILSGGEKCPKCKSTNTYYVEKQAKSADEATTLFYTCMGCGNHWSV